MFKEYQDGKEDRLNKIETMLKRLKASEDEAINQLIQGEISLDLYCDFLVGEKPVNLKSGRSSLNG